jgi:hypothetical protein
MSICEFSVLSSPRAHEKTSAVHFAGAIRRRSQRKAELRFELYAAGLVMSLVGPSGIYFSFDFNIEILFGLVEFQAYVCWKANVCAYVPKIFCSSD